MNDSKWQMECNRVIVEGARKRATIQLLFFVLAPSLPLLAESTSLLHKDKKKIACPSPPIPFSTHVVMYPHPRSPFFLMPRGLKVLSVKVKNRIFKAG
jgi:hypothetical protein